MLVLPLFGLTASGLAMRVKGITLNMLPTVPVHDCIDIVSSDCSCCRCFCLSYQQHQHVMFTSTVALSRVGANSHTC